ncbi:hypothetical protein ABK040_016301 [Willaertia magna]
MLNNLFSNNQNVVSWNPNTSTWFSVISNKEINYYKINEQILSQAVEDESISISDQENQEFNLLSSTSLPSEALCHAWSPESKEIMAIGLSNGSVLLDDVLNDQHIIVEFNRNDTSNKSKITPSPCRCIDWNPIHTNLILVGYDKTQKQSCVALWDLNRISHFNNTTTSSSTTGFSDTESVITTNSSDQGGLTFLNRDITIGNQMSNLSNMFYTKKKSSTLINSLQVPSKNYFTTKTITKPAYELFPGEGASSISWIPGQTSTFILGTNLKYIRLFDLREYISSMKTYKPTKNFAVHNKAVLGILFNPFDNNQFATYSEDSIVKIWDLRKMPSPIKEINTSLIGNKIINQSNPTSIQQIQWSTSHKNVLGVLTKDSNTVKICDLSDQNSKSIKYKISPYKAIFSSSGSLTSFSFHPTIPRCILFSTSTGLVQYTFLKEFVKFSISCHDQIVSSQKKNLIENNISKNNDINTIMKERAKYSFGIDILNNMNISREFKDIDGIVIWSWLYRMKELNRMNGRNQPNELSLIGIQKILESTFDNNNNIGDNNLPFKPLPLSNIILSENNREMYKNDYNNSLQKPFMKIFTSIQRSICLYVCGWDNEYLKSLKSLREDSKDHLNERSAAIAIFNLDIKAAANILSLLSDSNEKSNYKFLAYALGGYSEERKTEFQQVYKTLYPKLEDPYLSAAFGFLTSEPKDVKCVLKEKTIPVNDRIAFACYYLNDDELLKYIYKLKAKAIKNGDIQGIIITGLQQSQDSLSLIQKYVDRTCDVQTASLLCNRTLRNVNQHQLGDVWMETYRDLLDRWKMWEERAYLDIGIEQVLRGENIIHSEGTFNNHANRAFSGISTSTQPTVSVKCVFCNQSLHHSSLLLSKGGRQAQLATKQGNTSSMPKTTSCPSCRKPLPKCSVCLMPFGSPPHSMGSSQTSDLDFSFAWCTRCKHGGHVKHLLDWFKTHEECPVSDCTCKCFSYL